MSPSDLDPWDRGAGEFPRSPPGPRRISAADLTSRTPSSTPSRPPPSPSSASGASGAGASPDPACETCRGGGWLVASVPYGHPDFGQLRRCGCLEASAVAARAARAARYLDAIAGDLGDLASCSLETFDRRRPLAPLVWWSLERDDATGQRRPDAAYSVAQQRQLLGRAAAIIRDYAGSESLYLWGPPGSGKSHLAAAALNACAAAGVAGRYASAPELLLLLRRGFGDHSADERLTALLEVPLLGIDDLGVEQGGDWADQTLFLLVNTRLIHGRPTLITSNLPPEQLRDPRIASRVGGHYTTLPVIASDYRAIAR